MNVGIYQGASAMTALEQWQQSVAQNISAASVSGYKASELSVAGLDYGTLQDRVGGAVQAAIMPQGRTQTSFTQGSLNRTGNPTDVAIEGEGFFAVSQADGKTRYTRGGEFSVNSANQLVTGSGETVQGVGGPITLLPSGAPIAIDAGGQVYQGNQLVGRLRIVTFEDKTQLSKVSGGFVASDDGLAVADTRSKVAQGYVEGSNVSTVDEMIKLIQISRAQEANQKVLRSYDERLGRVNQVFTR